MVCIWFLVGGGCVWCWRSTPPHTTPLQSRLYDSWGQMSRAPNPEVEHPEAPGFPSSGQLPNLPSPDPVNAYPSPWCSNSTPLTSSRVSPGLSPRKFLPFEKHWSLLHNTYCNSRAKRANIQMKCHQEPSISLICKLITWVSAACSLSPT